MKHSLSGLPKAFMIIILISFSSLLFFSCGGGGDDAPPAPTPIPTTTGVFLDSPVDGLTYAANPSGLSGTTQNGGEFECRSGDTVDFSVGDVNLGEAPCQVAVTPVDLVSGAADETNPVVTNIARFLQSLDSDLTSSNGISINSATVAEVNGRNINITDPTLDFDNDVDIQALFAVLGVVPVTAAEAQDQLRSTLIGFTKDELPGKTYQVTEAYPTCVYDITFINDHQFEAPGEEIVDFVIENGTMVISDPPVSTTISVLSRVDSIITASVSVTGGSFVDETDSTGGLWGSDFSSLNNSAIALKDLFIAAGFWPGSTITADGRVTNEAASFDGNWWIDNNVFYFAYPEEDGCVDYKAYKLVNDRLLFATDADNTATFTFEEK